MNTRIIIAVVMTMFSCQQVHAQAEPEAEATELEGTWATVSYVINGVHEECDGSFWRFEGNRRYTRIGNAGNWRLLGTFSVNPSAMPAEFDHVLPQFEFHGIYEIDDDRLMICLGDSKAFEPGPRPDRFESTEDYPTHLLVFRRVE